ncbi:dihydroflavonal-4-reductase [Aspergillus saccharolyticus JOP 1030-1]|uniref:Dihydroflavonal-4-reductase n=1 Tax=Aspergillus saccharolyticus JOP 1030-1 TaxID=1450539 RepID=A0A318ZHN2_9EURO|nr:dihydroflavonal-4-reductase [Aspergillus saccharolyticus JOP 1030-1]PYH47081.1 dihydroflavonal-4-reductase [Aspergillus saccharolyticus JOP 1030-1]
MAPLVFITGATGFIGSQVVLSTLRAGYRVRLSIRSDAQETALRARYPDFAHMIETCIIPDITPREAFLPALADVDHIFHLASPMPGRGSDLQADYIDPAVKGTESILYSALSFPQIQKVVIMSSVLALTPLTALSQKEVYVTDNTNEHIPLDLPNPLPAGFSGHGLKYSASKIAAHQATRAFLATHSPPFTLITFHPTFVLGESLIQTNPEEISGMNALFWQSVLSETPGMANAWVDVRDVAEAHVRALQREDLVSGTEFLLSGPTPGSWKRVAEVIQSRFPEVGCRLQGPLEEEAGWRVDTRMAERVLGMRWRGQDEIVEAVVRQQLRLRGKI